MRSSRILAFAWENITQRKLRTSLTTLGVIIGIMAIISQASLGEGFRSEIKDRMQTGFEIDNLTVIPGSFFAGLSRERFTDIDVQRISNILGIKVVTQVIQVGNVTLYNGDKMVRAFVATGVNFTEFAKAFPDRIIFENGRLPEQQSDDAIVIGYKVNHPTEDETTSFAVANDTVTLTLETLQPYPPYHKPKNYTFTVAGTLQKVGTTWLTNFDYWVFMPLEKARQIYKTQESDLIFVKIYNIQEAERIANVIEGLFPPFKVTILVPLTLIRQVDHILNIIQIFLMAIAFISLLVAGIGIMNIMTVSVMERTREIGILKAIGAQSRTVLTMFLTEATLIGIIGGLIGVLIGYGLSYALAYTLVSFIQPQGFETIFQSPENQRILINPVFSPEWTIIAFIFAIIVCIIFGMYPARKAAKLDPVEALRYE